MSKTILYVEKGADQMRSTLIAYGLADLLYHLDRPNSGIEVRIQDRGSTYRLDVNRTRDALLNHVREKGLPALLPAILKPLSAKETKRVESGESEAEVRRRYLPLGFTGKVIDYGQEKQKEQEGRQNKRKKTREEGDQPTRPPDYPLWAHLCSYFGKGSAMRIGYPLVIHAWHAHQDEGAEALCDLVLQCYSDFPNRVDTAETIWGDRFKAQLDYADFELFKWSKPQQTAISALSVVSPTTAQGSATETGSRGINNETPNIFWLEMYLAFVGYMVGAMPFNAGGDALLYYPVPRDITFTHLQHAMSAYRDSAYVRELYDYSNFLPRVKIDALSQIAFYINMVKHYRDNILDPNAPPWEQVEINALSGLVGYYYKDISTQIPFDETTFALPRWLALTPDSDALENALQILEAHRELIRAIRGEYAEELAILTAYRRFITLGDPADWIEFTILYSQHRFNKMVDASWMSHIHIDVLEKTLMNNPHQDFRPILADEGFRNIANAIRHCTVQTRYFKDVKKQQITFKVRHGLGDDLRRRAHDDAHFIEDLSEFIFDYLRESSNVQANTGETRPYITDADIADVVALVEQYGGRVVANLLVATGYASKFTIRQIEPDTAEA